MLLSTLPSEIAYFALRLLDPAVWGVALAALLYARGLPHLRSRERPHGLPGWRVVSFYLGLITVVLAVLSPLDALGHRLFFMHMLQHMLLMMVAAPLLLLGAPVVPITRGLPRSLRRTAVARAARLRAARWALHGLTTPAVALSVYAANLWLWHLPVLYEAALESTAVHVLGHALFLITGLLFADVIIDRWPFRNRLAHGPRLVLLALAMALDLAVGVTMTYSTHLLYPYYATQPRVIAYFTPMIDQQTGGLLMWVGGATLHLMAMIIVFARWLIVDSERARAEDALLEAREAERPDTAG